MYLFFPLFFCARGDTYSQNGGEDVTSRQHDRGGRHGPPRAPVRRLIPWKPEEPLWPQWNLCKSIILYSNNNCINITENCLSSSVTVLSCIRLLWLSLPPKIIYRRKLRKHAIILLFLHSLTHFSLGYRSGTDTETTVISQSINHITKECRWCL